jgi:hypothetical protein
MPDTDWGEDLGYLWICGACRHLKEVGRPDGMEQRCECPGSWKPDDERWPRYDFNERAILCRCCGLEAVSSGSRWAPFFCRECQLLAMGVSVWERRLIFPIGRHTMMHTWVPGAKPGSPAAHGGDGDALAETVYESLQVVSKGREGLEAWYPFVMAYNLRRLGFQGEVRLSAYLAAVEREELAVLAQRLVRFEGLCEFFKHGTMALRGGRKDMSDG